MSSRKTYDTDTLIVHKIFAYDSNNAPIPASRCLTSTGDGGTTWAYLSNVGSIPSYNQVNVDGLQYLANSNFNTLHLSSYAGIGFVRNSTTKEVGFYAKAFQQFDVSGGNTLKAYSNSLLTPTIRFVGTQGVHISADPLTNTMTITGAPTDISTGIYAYNQINVISNASTLKLDALSNTNNQVLTSTSPSTMLKMVAVGDLIYTTNTTSNAIFLNISTFTSKGYLDLSGIAFGTLSSALSTVSTLFEPKGYASTISGSNTSTTLTALSNVSVGIQQKFAFDNQNLMLNYTPLATFNVFSNTTSQTLSNFVNLKSSLGTQFENCNVQAVFFNARQLYMSSAQFRLDSLSSFIFNEPTVQLTYFPSLLFTSNTTNGGTVPITRVMGLSTLIRVNNNILEYTTVSRPWQAINSNASNVFTDTCFFELNQADMLANITSTFTIGHLVDNYTGLASEYITNLTTNRNSLKISLTR
jgi:hypothetical protein